MTRNYPVDTLARSDTGKFRSNGGVERDAKILNAALALADRHGLRHLTRSAVAREAGVSAGSVSNFGREQSDQSPDRDHMSRLRAAVMRAAIDRGILSVLAEGVATGDPVAMAAPADLRATALASRLS